MTDKKFPKSDLPIRKSVELLPNIFQTDSNSKFLAGVLDPMVQPGVLEKISGYIGKRYGKTFNSSDVYLDTDQTLRSRYQLEPGVILKNKRNEITDFYDYLDFKNQLKFFGNNIENDDKINEQVSYTWNPPIDWDKFVNFREYYWEPLGPPLTRISGNSVGITSTYRVSIGIGSSWIFSPDGFTNNPTLTLYRGQKYVFKINALNNPFVIKTNYDTGSLLFNPNKTYFTGQVVLFNNKLWKAKNEVSPLDGSTIDDNSQDWQFVENASEAQSLDYNKGVTNNGIDVGDVIFEVPYDAPDILFYQSRVDPDRVGRLLISDIDTNTFIDIEKEIIGKISYTSSNGIEFTNGLVVEFTGKTQPARYQRDAWLVEGVGSSITLTKFLDLVVPKIRNSALEVLFDDQGFDSQPFDDAASFPLQKDYITIARNSKDSNAWSRYNRWFHKSVLEQSYKVRGRDFPADENLRAKRPIIEFLGDLQLFNHGSESKLSVDFIDTFTTDVFSKIEGSAGYSVDGEFLFDGARLLVIADTDVLANNKIYTVKFITHLTKKQIHLEESFDTVSQLNECVLIKKGNLNSGKMYHFNGEQWVISQEKISVNQPPLFDVFDNDGVSFSDQNKYTTSTFYGTPILSYASGNGSIDKELGFNIQYLNIDNIGDIQFQWNWEIDTFSYILNISRQPISVSSGYYLFNNEKSFQNGWIEKDSKYSQILLDTTVIIENTNEIISEIINWNNVTSDLEYEILFEINGEPLGDTAIRQNDTFIFNKEFKVGDVIVTKLKTSHPPKKGYYEIPAGLEKNPLNNTLSSFTFGEASDHVGSALEFRKDFNGNFPGISNLRDLNEYRAFGKRFLKHETSTPLSVFLLCDKKFNVIKSIRYSANSYTEFKNNIIKKSTEIEYNEDISKLLDEILNEINKVKSSSTSFFDSDMLGTGASKSNVYKIDDDEIRTFTLSEKFNLSEPSTRAVYVYYNHKQLLHGRDYEFDENFGFVKIKSPIKEGEEIEIKEYNSTSFNFIPPTPTKLGLYKRFEPKKFIDDTYREPREVIQGHDGSITLAFNDFRDDLLLEFETRIFNNLKVQDYLTVNNEVDQFIGNYYNTDGFSREDINQLISQDFLRWAANTGLIYSKNNFFDSEDPFTYTYSEMADPTGQQKLPGYWRGVYYWFYDTYRPHICPWELLGFSEKPQWWDSEYGPAPYTSGNLILWEDLENGIVRQGPTKGINNRYKRPGLTNIIPVDEKGNLINPIDSGLASNFVLVNNKGTFKFGDISPVEYAWRSSSEYPFSLILSFCLLKPFSYIGNNLDNLKTVKNKISQTVSVESNSFIKLSNFVSSNDNDRGLITYIFNYLKFLGISKDEIYDRIGGIDVNLSSRLSGFVDKEQQKYLLDTKNPRSTSSSIFIPPENYEIIFDVSAPIDTLTYSGVIIEKTSAGWTIQGYDTVFPYFEYFEPIPNQKGPIISVGGISAPFRAWEEGENYNNGQIILYRNDYYRSLKTHNSGNEFDESLWTRLPKLPIVGGVEAVQRKSFDTFSSKQISYGTEFKTVQEVVDFLLGYEQFLISKGFVFDRYDKDLQVSRNWVTSAKEFLFWTKQNWSDGSLISLSPASQEITINYPVGVADNLLDSFYEYQVLTSNGVPLPPNLLNVERDFQKTIIKVDDDQSGAGVYFLKVSYILKEHVVIFDDRTVFNDVIYDETTGYRQERIKSFGFRTVDWDGDYTSPGFLFDNVNIDQWQPFKEYRLGDVVSYKSVYWVSKINHFGTEFFNDNNWSKLDSIPTKQLIPNFDYRINLFEDYFEVSAEGIGQTQRDIARHTLGYQPRQYLENLAEDPSTQFQLYQGFIREKGTKNSISKVFDKVGPSNKPSLELSEEWAIHAGRFGGTDQITEIELELDKSQFLLNPQPIIYSRSTEVTSENKQYIVNDTNSTKIIKLLDNGLFPVKESFVPALTAGYVNFNQIEFVLPTYDSFSNLDIELLKENNHVWVTFDNNSWNVYRFNRSQTLVITSVIKDDDRVILTLNRKHSLKINDFVGVKLENLFGFFKIVSSTNNTITFLVDPDGEEPIFDISTISPIWKFTPMRFDSYRSINFSQAALLPDNSKIWIDKNENNLWEVVEKKKQFKALRISEYGISDPKFSGSKVLYDDVNKLVISSIPGSGYVMTYYRTATGLDLRQIIPAPAALADSLVGSFGEEMTLSPDSRWLFVGSPRATEVPSDYRGIFNPFLNYIEGNVVLFAGTLYRAKTDISGDGSTINVTTQDWEPTDNIFAPGGTINYIGFPQQGAVSIYEFVQQQWVYRNSLVSPRPEAGENFGQSVSIGIDNGEYTAAISAPGALTNLGRVYLYTFKNNQWRLLQNANYRGIYNSGFEFVGRLYIDDDGVLILEVEEIDPWAKLEIGMTINGLGVLPQTVISDFFGATGGIGKYKINKAQTVPLDTLTAIAFYPKDSIVWYNGNLWQANQDTFSDLSTVGIDSSDWTKLDDIVTTGSLPKSVSIEDDGSSLTEGILGELQIAELVKKDDRFGTRVAMDYTGNILVVSAPFSDGQFFANYKGNWTPELTYNEGDVVRYQKLYYKLVNTTDESNDSIQSTNQDPTLLPWVNVGDSSSESTGKIFIYEKNKFGRYELKQTITTGTLELYNNLSSNIKINVGDEFGSAIDLDYSASTLVVSSPKADINFQNQGSVYVFEKNSSSGILEYRLIQKLESFEDNPNEYFGQDVKISPNTDKIIVGANNSPFITYTAFDFGRTLFDGSATKFFDDKGFAGSVYVFEKKDSQYFLTEKLDDNLVEFESFGYSVDCTDSLIIVGSPDYISPLSDETITKPGLVRLFEKDPQVKSWTVLERQVNFVDLAAIRSISVIDPEKLIKISDIDLIDPINFKILNVADREIKFKTEYDPAIYNVGSDEVIVDDTISWKDVHVGQLWWNISRSKWVNYNQGDLSYKVSNWGKLALGSTIQVCEWVESNLLPSEWEELADTTEGLAQGISGQPLYPNDENYTIKELFNPVTGELTNTLYYYWVQNKNTLPNVKIGRKITATDVSILISDPASLGFTFAALVDKNTILTYNFDRLIRENSILLNLTYSLDKTKTNLIHNEFQLLSEETDEDELSSQMERKWLDSLIGADSQGNRVPKEDLPEKLKYGISFRPRQSIFKNRIPILKDSVLYLNDVLKQRPFTDQIDFTILNSKEETPSPLLNLYDVIVEQDIDLQNVGTVRVRQAKLKPNIVDGYVDTIDIVDSGFGYRVPPPVVISGDGVNAEASCLLDSQGRVKEILITNRGRKYSQSTAFVRPFSVLVNFDRNQDNLWSIYSWDTERRVFFKTRTQSFDTSRFWKFVDWWKEGYSPKDRIVVELDGFYQEPSVNVKVGELIKVSNYSNGTWAVLEKIKDNGDNFENNYVIVGRDRGTIELLDKIYNTALSGTGFDSNRSFDTGLYDVENTKELRNILESFKKDILINDLKNEWKKLFFKSLRYVLVEQPSVDWVFKTSFVKIKHNVGFLEKKINFKNDNIDSYIDYFNEVKPYRTKVRSFVSSYESLLTHNSALSDFDLPPVYSTEENRIITTTSNFDEYPQKWWNDNNSYEIIDIVVVTGGEGYTSSPTVSIIGNGQGATARAFISNGSVSKIIVESPGANYTTAPEIILVGGTRSVNTAKAISILGNSKVRTFDISLKFDRITKDGVFFKFDKEESIVASGATSSFDLKYPPQLDKRNISVLLNNDLLLSSDYSITLYNVTVNGNSIPRGRLILNAPPAAGDSILINYQINDNLLDSINRIEKYYEPGNGMRFKEPSQLMTGIDFGGVKIQGTTFDVTGGWDALPWFTDTWDSVSANSDFYFVLNFVDSPDSSEIYKPGQIVKFVNTIYVCKKQNIDSDGDTILPVVSNGWEKFWEIFFIKLPFVPAVGQKINVYLKRQGQYRPKDILNLQFEAEIPEPPTIRIDDPNFENINEVVNPNALMPTIVGDGVTSTFNVSQYDLQLQSGDTLIFRPDDSDGSITINDNNLLDTTLSGGTLAYSTATGLTADEISIDGSNFVSPDQVPAPEEIIPGQVLESLSIKVFNNKISGSSPIESFVKRSNGIVKKFKINLRILENNSIIVYVDNIKKLLTVDYEILWNENSIEFFNAPIEGSIIEIISLGIGGVQILDVQEFIADEDTQLFLTAANYFDTANVYVTVNGEFVESQFVNSSEFLDVSDRTLIQLGFKLNFRDIVKIICLGSSTDTDSSSYNIVRVNTEEFEYDGSTRKFDLKNFVNLERGSSLASSVVEVNGVTLRGVDTILEIYNGRNNSFVLGTDPVEPSGAILPSNIEVFINKDKKEFVQDYDYDGITKVLSINNNVLTQGDVIKIEVDFRTEFEFIDNDLFIKDTINLVEGDSIKITWFSEYPTVDSVSDEFVGGKINYRLKRIPLGISYVWAYKNGQRLIPDIDFYISGQDLFLIVDSSDSDLIKILQFGSSIYTDPVAYEIYHDMLNIDYFKRYSIGDVKLSKDLLYYDKEIYIDNIDQLYDPSINGKPGLLTINSEKIIFYKKHGNVLSQLRRGCLGSSIPEIHLKNSVVVDSSDTETIPYVEEQERYDFVGDGSSQLIGPLPFVPTKFKENNWFKSDIPEEYGPCYEIEVFVAGKRMKKDPVDVYDEELGSYSPVADKKIQAEFSVDGSTPFVRLSEPVPAGQRIIVIRKIGKIWYDRRLQEVSTLPLTSNANNIAKFIAQKTTKLPE